MALWISRQKKRGILLLAYTVCFVQKLLRSSAMQTAIHLLGGVQKLAMYLNLSLAHSPACNGTLLKHVDPPREPMPFPAGNNYEMRSQCLCVCQL